MSHDRFLYVTYIRTTPQKLWEALTQPDLNRAFWGCWQDTTWAPGADWKLMMPDGRVGDAGKVLEIDQPRRLVLEWRNQFRPELHAEGDSRCTFDIEPMGPVVQFTVTHEIDRDHSKFIEAMSAGWPMILSGLKSLLETGEALGDITRPSTDEAPRSA
jgi:uncharacterized protein YndB with AHSA1/START domain